MWRALQACAYSTLLHNTAHPGSPSPSSVVPAVQGLAILYSIPQTEAFVLSVPSTQNTSPEGLSHMIS